MIEVLVVNEKLGQGMVVRLRGTFSPQVARRAGDFAYPGASVTVSDLDTEVTYRVTPKSTRRVYDEM